MTPLHWAVERNYPDIADVLLKYGASKNIKSKFYQTAMDIAKENSKMVLYKMIQVSRF